MAGFITVEVNDRRLIEHLDSLPEMLKTALLPKITELTTALLNEVHAAEPVRTGRLVSATRMFIDEGQDYIAGKVRVVGQKSDIHRIAAALEYGAAHAFMSVKPYVRRGHPVAGYRRRENIHEYRFMRGPAASLRERALA